MDLNKGASAYTEPTEGGPCPELGCPGRLEYPAVDNCSCHLSPPCPQCTSNALTCTECGWENAPQYSF